MIIIGEKLNSSIPSTKKMMDAGDEETVRLLAKRQAEAGAQYLDVNTSVVENVFETMKWAVGIAMQETDCGIVVDSPDIELIEKVYGEIDLPDSIINSITLEQHKLNALLPLAKRYDAGVIALPLSEDGMPKSAQDRIDHSKKLVDTLLDGGITPQKIFVDIVVEAVGANYTAPKEALNALGELCRMYPDCHFTAGLSNVSFGLPGRLLLNRTFLVLAMAKGLSSAILDPLDGELMMQLRAAEMLLGQDEYCMEYITAHRIRQETE